MNLAAVIADIEHFQRRVIQDALNEATADYWRKRAQSFTDARPRPGDATGHAGPDSIAARDERLAAIAQACLAAAQIRQNDASIINAVLGEVA